MATYTFATLTASQLEELNALYKVSFNHNNAISTYRWKYFENNEGDAIVIGAFYEGKLVASGAMIPELFDIENKRELIFKCTDLMTHPDHQKKGLSKSINELLRKEVQRKRASCCYTLCSPISTKSFLKNGWTYIGPVLNYFQPRIFIKLKLIFKKSILTSDFCVSTSGDEYLGIKRDESSISKTKNNQYITWRLSNPRYSYKIIYKYDHTRKVIGSMVVSYSSRGVLNLIDIQCAEDKTRDDLLQFAEGIVANNNLKGLVVMCIENTKFHSFIRGKGYFRNPFSKGPLKSNLDFDILCLDSERMKLFGNPSSWGLNGLNYDDV